MSDRYPPGVSPKQFDEPNNRKRVRVLSIDDLLDRPLEVLGLHLDARVDVVLRQVGASEPEVDWIEIREVYLHLPSVTDQFHLTDDLLLLDQSSLKTRNKRLYEAFERAVETHAVNRAKLAPDSQWEVLDEND